MILPQRCICCSLETGVKVIAYIHLIFHGFMVIFAVSLLTLLLYDQDLKIIRRYLEESDVNAFDGRDSDEIKKMREGTMIILFVILIVSSAAICSAYLVFHAIRTVS